MKLPGEFFLWGTEQTFRGVFTLGVGGPRTPHLPSDPTRGYVSPNRNPSWTTSKTVNVLIATVCVAPLSASEALAIQRFVLAKMDHGFTLKLNADTLSLELPKTGAIAQLNSPTEQLASVD